MWIYDCNYVDGFNLCLEIDIPTIMPVRMGYQTQFLHWILKSYIKPEFKLVIFRRGQGSEYSLYYYVGNLC